MPRTTIPIEEAQKLSQSKKGVNLDITSGLTPEIAALLVKSEGGVRLVNLTVLKDDVAEILATYPGDLQLGGPRLRASDMAIDNLSSHRGPALHIQNIFEFNLEMANSLAQHEGGRLAVSSYNDVGFTEEALVALSKHKGDLWILAKCELTNVAIKALLKHKGELMIPQVTNMSRSIENKFKKLHEGPVFCGVS